MRPCSTKKIILKFSYHLIDLIIEGEKPGPHCKGPPTFGFCKPLWPRGYTFDSVSKTCKEVLLRGCGLTNNGFINLEECETKCSKFAFLNSPSIQ